MGSLRRLPLFGFIAASTLGIGQPGPRFDVATVRKNQSGEVESGSFDHGRLVIRAAPLRHLISSAYGKRLELITGGPSWVDNDLFDIEAKTDPSTTEAASRLLLRTLLAERFELRIHFEERNRSVLLLNVAKGGPKLKLSPRVNNEQSRCVGTAPLRCTNRSMAQLADVLPRISTGIDAPVVDETGLDGRYDFTLSFAQQTRVPPGAGAGAPIDEEKERERAPSVFTAIRDQLGLELKAGIRPTEYLVIDSARRSPTEN